MPPPSKKKLLAKKKSAAGALACWTREGLKRSQKQKSATKVKVAETVARTSAALAQAAWSTVRRTVCWRLSLTGDVVLWEGVDQRRGSLTRLGLADIVPHYLQRQRWQLVEEVWTEPRYFDELQVRRAAQSAQDDPLGRVLFAHKYTEERNGNGRAPNFTCCLCSLEERRENERLLGCCSLCARPLECAMLAQHEFGEEQQRLATSFQLEVPMDIGCALAMWLSYPARAAEGPSRWRPPQLRGPDKATLCVWCDRPHSTPNEACAECEDLHKWARLALVEDVRATLARWERGEKLVPGSRRLLAHFTQLAVLT